MEEKAYFFSKYYEIKLSDKISVFNMKNLRIFLKISFFIFIFLIYSGEALAAGLNYESTKVIGGGTGWDYGAAMKTDSSGNLFVTGQFSAGTIDFDPTSGVDERTNANAGYDIFLTRYNADGTYAWTKTWGGTGSDAASSIAIDASNNVYVVGEFASTVDFDPGVGTTSKTSAGSVDFFVSKFSNDGEFISVSVFGEASHDRGHGVAIGSAGEIYTVGKFNGTTDFDPTSGTDNQTSAGDYDAFITKYNTDGSYAWTRIFGSTGRDTINDIQLGSDGSIYLAGVYRSTVDFDLSGSTTTMTSAGLDDAFLLKLNSDGSFAWVKGWGSTSNDFTFNLRVDGSNNIYVIGSFQLTVDFDPSGSTNSISATGSEDAYVSKFSSDGTYVFTRTWGGVLMDEVLGITFDPSGNYYIGGFFNGTADLDPTSGTDSQSSSGPYDMFVSMFDANDNYVLSKKFGSTNEVNWYDDQLYELHAGNGKLYVTGNYLGTADFDPGVATDSYTSAGSVDFFLSTYDLAYDPTATIGTPAQVSASNTISFTATVADADNATTTLQVQYSADGSTWASSTLGSVTGSTTTVSTVTGQISNIGTNTGTTTLTIAWLAGTDLANTYDSSVYLRIKPYDGTAYASGFTTSTAFAVDTRTAATPTGLTIYPEGQTLIRLDWTGNNPTYIVNNTTLGATSSVSTAYQSVVSGLSCATSYTFKVLGQSFVGTNSDYTSTVSATTYPCPGGGTAGGGGGSSSAPSVQSVPAVTVVTPIVTAPAASTPTLIQLQSQLAALMQQLQSMQALRTPAASYSFTSGFGPNSRGEQVRQLQIYLNTHGFPVALSGVGSAGSETTFFGPATTRALLKFQESLGLVSTPWVGPATRAHLNK